MKSNLANLVPLRVFVIWDETAWFAQGVDIDYFANGETKKEVEVNFKNGLVSLFKLHLAKFGNTNHIQRLPAHVLKYKEIGNYSVEKTKQVTLGTSIRIQDPEFVYNTIEFIYLKEEE